MSRRNKVFTTLIKMLYERNDIDFKRGLVWVRGEELRDIIFELKAQWYI